MAHQLLFPLLFTPHSMVHQVRYVQVTWEIGDTLYLQKNLDTEIEVQRESRAVYIQGHSLGLLDFF